MINQWNLGAKVGTTTFAGVTYDVYQDSAKVRIPGPPGGLPGQNVQVPYAEFQNHEVVLYGSTIYDPSYGRDYTNLKGWETAALAGVAFRTSDTSPIYVAKQKDATEETNLINPPSPP